MATHNWGVTQNLELLPEELSLKPTFGTPTYKNLHLKD